jgi:hypothetical protein
MVGLSGCALTRELLPTIPYYEGPILPDDQVAIIHQKGDVFITGIDDKSYGRFEPVAVLPGQRFISARISFQAYCGYFGCAVDIRRCGFFKLNFEAGTEYLLKDRDNRYLVLKNKTTGKEIKIVDTADIPRGPYGAEDYRICRQPTPLDKSEDPARRANW